MSCNYSINRIQIEPRRRGTTMWLIDTSMSVGLT